MNSIPRLDLLADFDSSSSKRREVCSELISETLHCFALALVLGVLLSSGSVVVARDGVEAPLLLLLPGEALAFAFCLHVKGAATPFLFGVLMVRELTRESRAALLQLLAMLRRERERLT